MFIEVQRNGAQYLKITMIPLIEPWATLRDPQEQNEDEKNEIPKEGIFIINKKWNDKTALIIQRYFKNIKRFEVKQDIKI